jgi:hypothetical protein
MPATAISQEERTLKKPKFIRPLEIRSYNSLAFFRFLFKTNSAEIAAPHKNRPLPRSAKILDASDKSISNQNCICSFKSMFIQLDGFD